MSVRSTFLPRGKLRPSDEQLEAPWSYRFPSIPAAVTANASQVPLDKDLTFDMTFDMTFEEESPR